MSTADITERESSWVRVRDSFHRHIHIRSAAPTRSSSAHSGRRQTAQQCISCSSLSIGCPLVGRSPRGRRPSAKPTHPPPFACRHLSFTLTLSLTMRNFTLTLQPAAIYQNPDRFAIISHIINPLQPFLLEESKLPVFVLIKLFHIKIIALSCI